MKAKILTLSMAVLIAAGCVSQPIVKHSQVLIFNRPYDYTYNKVIEAISLLTPWQLASTTKSAGEIILINQDYWDTLDADKRTAKILIKRLSRRQTAVELAPESQSVIGVGDILKTIDQTMAQYKL